MTIDWQTFWLTLQLAVIVSVALLVLGLPIAYWLARTLVSSPVAGPRSLNTNWI